MSEPDLGGRRAGCAVHREVNVDVSCASTDKINSRTKINYSSTTAHPWAKASVYGWRVPVT